MPNLQHLSEQEREFYKNMFGEEEATRGPASISGPAERTPAADSDVLDFSGRSKMFAEMDKKQKFRNIMRGVEEFSAGLAGHGTKPDTKFYDRLDKQDDSKLLRRKELADNVMRKWKLGQADRRLSSIDMEQILKQRKAEQTDKRLRIQEKRFGIAKESAKRKQESVLRKQSVSQRKRTIPGHGVALDEVSARKIRQKNLGLTNGIVAGRELLAFVGQRSKYVTDIAAALKYSGQATSLVAELKAAMRIDVTGGGNISDAEQALLNKIVPNPMRIFSLDITNRAVLEGMISKFERRQGLLMEAEGVYPVKPKRMSQEHWDKLDMKRKIGAWMFELQRNPSSMQQPPTEVQ